MLHTSQAAFALASGDSDFIPDAITAISRLKSWRVLLGLGKAHADRMGVSGLPTDPLQRAALVELCSALAGLRRIDVIPTHFTSILCGAGISLSFEPKVCFTHILSH